jgi:tetratricopeptide (TPR) repeat protein
MASDLAQRAVAHYEAGEFEELLSLAAEAWPGAVDAELPPGIAELCRFARLVAHKRGLEAAVQLWDARALTAAVMAGNRNVAAGLLLPRVFQLLALREYGTARIVLAEQLRLLDEDSDLEPSSASVLRMYHEKTAYSYFAEGDYTAAEAAYGDALRYEPEGSRGHLKVRGGQALGRYLSGDRATWPSEELLAEMLAIADAAGDEYPDVAEAAAANARMIAAGGVDGWVVFEVL